MPFKSDAQRRLMYAVAEDPKLAEEKGIPQSVAQEFIAKDKSEKKGKSLKKVVNDAVDKEAPAVMSKRKEE